MMTLVVASLVERSIAGVARSSKKAFAAGAGAVELRMDHLVGLASKPSMLDEAREAVDGPAIATLRSSREGGRSRLKRQSRARLLERAFEAGFEYIDLELTADSGLITRLRGKGGSTKTIASYHFRRPATRHELLSRLGAACEAADIGKVATPCEHAGHAAAVASAALEFSGRGREFAIMGMGAQGQLTRACAGKMGSELVYACLPGAPAAPGQLDITLQSALIEKDSFVFGLIGHPVAHSVSKPMQEAALRSVNLNGIYLPLDVPPAHMTKEFVSTLFDSGFTGLNVTIPHKERAHRICESLGASAESTGAVNTVHRRRGRIVGENTDLIGLKKLLESQKIPLRNRKSLVVGAGGAARAACRVLRDGGAEVTVTARKAGRAAVVARACDGRGLPLDRASSGSRRWDVVVNATPIGTWGSTLQDLTVPPGVLEGRPVFIDLVYNPPVTESMRLARRKGCETVGGLDMLVGQGAEAFRTWTGRSPDEKRMRAAARRALR
ncbi:TPA: shikimate dehydrogenase [Thermoplasmata archaeon]|nr:shikimate dehydrogenase [Thermoplasmata archaeon]